MSASAHRFVMSVIPNDNHTKRVERGSNPECYVAVRSNQVVFDRHEAQPSGKSQLPVVGVSGFSALVFGPSASVRVQARLSLIMAGDTS